MKILQMTDAVRKPQPHYATRLVWALCTLIVPSAVQAQSQRVDFESGVQAIFSSRCYVCHGPSTQMSGLRLDSRNAALKGGDSGKKAIIPG